MRAWFSLVLFFVAVSRGVAAPEVVLVFTSDQHSAHARMAQFVALVDRVTAEHAGVPVAALINGDTFESGNSIARRSGGEFEYAFFRALAQRVPTVLNLGNHEPDFHDVATTVARAQACGVTVISNLVDRDSGKPFTSATTRLKLGQRELVIAGLTTDLLTTYRVAIRPTLDLANPAVWAEENFPTIFAAADLPIVMAHTGLKADREILQHTPRNALYVAGHDHARFLARPEGIAYAQSGAWGGFASIARLENGAWSIEQVALTDELPTNPELAAIAARVEEQHATAEDREVVGRSALALGPEEAARFAVEAVRAATGADAAVIGATTFGGGVSAGKVTRMEFDAWVRFEGQICVAEISGAELLTLASRANLGPDAPWEKRGGENLVLVTPEQIDPTRMYRIATNDWAVKNTRRYFGENAPTFAEVPEMRLKSVVARALQP